MKEKGVQKKGTCVREESYETIILRESLFPFGFVVKENRSEKDNDFTLFDYKEKTKEYATKTI